MVKKQRIPSHKRRVHTKNGVKRRRVKSYSRKVTPVATRKQREMMAQLGELPFEVGGFIDSENSKMDHAVIYTGEESTIDWEPNEDYEQEFHTHPPPLQKMQKFPSLSDMLDFVDHSRTQTVSMIEHKGHIFVMRKNPEFTGKRVHDQLIDIDDTIDRMLFEGKTAFQIEQKLKTMFKKIGIYVDLITPKEKFKLTYKEVNL